MSNMEEPIKGVAAYGRWHRRDIERMLSIYISEGNIFEVPYDRIHEDWESHLKHKPWSTTYNMMGFKVLSDAIRNESSNVTVDDFGLLSCPHCTSDYLHQQGVTTSHRFYEDGPARVTKVPAYGRLPSSTLVEGVTGRRSSLVIVFRCEECHYKSDRAHLLTIRQEKGRTYMSWNVNVAGHKLFEDHV